MSSRKYRKIIQKAEENSEDAVNKQPDAIAPTYFCTITDTPKNEIIGGFYMTSTGITGERVDAAVAATTFAQAKFTIGSVGFMNTPSFS